MIHNFIGIAVVLLGLVSGCSNTYCHDMYPYQPISRKGVNTSGEIVIGPKDGIDWAGKSQYITKIEWKTGGFKITDSERVINLCTEYVDGISYHFKLDDNECPHDDRYPWMSSSMKSTRDYLRDRQGPRIYCPNIQTIVCLKPLVVIIGSGCIAHYRGSFLYIDDIKQDYRSIVLRNGYAYGTRIPYSQDLQWYSPDLNVSPCPIEMLSESQGFISVPWGRLILNKEGDEWIVSAERK